MRGPSRRGVAVTRALWVKIGATGILLGAAAVIIIYTASQSSGLFRFVDEVRTDESSLKDREIWMAGVLEPNSHQVRATRGERQEHRFKMSHKGVYIDVSYTGSMPQNVKPGLQLVVRGKLAPTGQFRADEIRTKCPSKYKAEYEARK